MQYTGEPAGSSDGMRSGYCYHKTGCSPLSFLFFGAKIVLLFQTSQFYAEKLDFRILIQRKVVSLHRVL
jgi:hypothetical protein